MAWNLFKKKEKRSDAVLSTPGGVGLPWAMLLHQSDDMRLSAFFRCVQMIASGVAMMPVEVVDGEGAPVGGDRVRMLFEDPNNLLTRYEMMYQLVRSVLLDGNGFIYIERAEDGKAVGLRWLEPGSVTVNYVKNSGTVWYQCSYIGGNAIEAANMIHCKISSADGVNGESMRSIGSRVLKMAQLAESNAIDFYEQHCNVNGVLTVQSALTPQQIKDIKQSWSETYTMQHGGIAVLQGNMDYKPVGSSASDAQMIETREHSINDVCRLFGINPLLLGSNSGASYGTFEAAQDEFVTRTLMPYVHMIEQEMTRKLFVPSERKNGLKINLDENALLRANKTSEAAYYTSLTNNGILTVNEAREQLGYKPMDGGDDLHIPFSDASQNKLTNNNQNNEDE